MKLRSAHVISLPDASARRRNMIATLEDARLSAEFFDAFNARDSSEADTAAAYHSLLSGKFLQEFSHINKPGTFGCSLSHLLLWDKFSTQNHEPGSVYLVMEDDVSLAPYFLPCLYRVLAELPEDFHFCFLGGWPSDPRFRLSQPKIAPTLAVMRHFCLTSTAIYLINPNLLDQIRSILVPFTDEIDVHIADARAKLNIMLYAGAAPCCLTQVGMGSQRLTLDSK